MHITPIIISFFNQSLSILNRDGLLCPGDVAPFGVTDFSLVDVSGWKLVAPEGVTSLGLLCPDVYQGIIDLAF